MQKLADAAVENLAGSHFEIGGPMRRIECCIAPTNEGGIYYTGPPPDFLASWPHVVVGSRG